MAAESVSVVRWERRRVWLHATKSDFTGECDWVWQATDSGKGGGGCVFLLVGGELGVHAGADEVGGVSKMVSGEKL